MNQFAKFQPEEFMKAAKEARIPENMQQFAGETVAKTQEAFEKMAVVAKDNAKASEEILDTAQTGAKELGDKVMKNVTSNTEAAFTVAQAMASAGSIPEAAKLQADFFQQQMALIGEQTKEFFELSTKLSQETFQSVNTVAAKSMEQFKANG